MDYSSFKSRHIEDIKQVFTRTFAESEGPSEGELIGNLAHEILTSTEAQNFYSFVAEDSGQIVGCIIFSRLSFESNANVFILSPVAISTSYQRQGIGKKLINFGLRSLKKYGVESIVTYGDPAYYSKVGFSVITETVIKAPLKLSMPEGWLGQSLAGDKIEPIAGHSYCIEALNKPAIW